MSQKQILLGYTENPHGGVHLDLDVLLRTRLLIQANSGGGKSWLLRRLAEQFYGRIPTLIIDPEGEFGTLREKFGYVLVGKGGETPADLRSARLVAHKLLELRASAVCDLYELKPQHRHQWVRTFLEGLIDAPKNLWRPTIVIVDEAHQYAPEGKAGESEASGAMVDLATRGRKRGFCAIFATQRLGKLRKDAAAELLNVMVGMTFIDIDRDRAAECLGVGREDKRAFNDAIKLLTEGKFYCLGRAICKERMLVKVGPVQTTHPEAGGGKYDAPPPPTPETVQRMLPKLADLPKAAEERAQTEAQLRTELRSLRAELSVAKRAQPKPVTPAPAARERVKEVPVLKDAQIKRIERVQERVERFGTVLVEQARELIQTLGQVRKAPAASPPAGRPVIVNRIGPSQPRPAAKVIPPYAIPPYAPPEDGEFILHAGERRILTAIAQHAEGVTREQIAVLTGYKKTSRTTYLQRLRGAGLIADGGRELIATAAGIEALGGSFEPLATGDALREYWMAKLKGGERKILEVLLAAYPNEVARESIDEATNYKKTSRTTFLQKLAARRLVDATRIGVKASDQLFG